MNKEKDFLNTDPSTDHEVSMEFEQGIREIAIDIVVAASHNYTLEDLVRDNYLSKSLRSVYMQVMDFCQSTNKKTPAVRIEDSVHPDGIICLEDGQKVKILKKHLKNKFNMTPDYYRARWGLSPDYPMVPKDYSISRSKLAQSSGLGHKKKAKSRV